MPKLSGNKGEWSEIYTFAYLLSSENEQLMKNKQKTQQKPNK